MLFFTSNAIRIHREVEAGSIIDFSIERTIINRKMAGLYRLLASCEEDTLAFAAASLCGLFVASMAAWCPRRAAAKSSLLTNPCL